MDPETARKLLKRAELTAQRMGFRAHKEDLAQSVLLKMLSKGFGQTVDQALIDSIREEFGRRGEKHSVGTPTSEQAERWQDDFFSLLEPLQSTDRAIICLLFIWGLTAREIAVCFGVTEQAICIRFKNARERMRSEV